MSFSVMNHDIFPGKRMEEHVFFGDVMNITAYRRLIVDVLWCGWVSLIIDAPTMFTSLVYLMPFSIETPFFNITFCHYLLVVAMCFNRVNPGLTLLKCIRASCKGTMFMFCHGQIDPRLCSPLNIYGMIFEFACMFKRAILI